jgi:DNA-binding XRE family transcriptional regulator
MPNPINSAAVGALIREAREAAGLTQTQLAERIGASRFWVAAFEKGKPSAELGLALKAIHALELTLHITPGSDALVPQTSAKKPAALPAPVSNSSLGNVLAHATLTNVARTSVVGWPTAKATQRTATKAAAPRKRKA